MIKSNREAKASATEAALNGLYVAPMTFHEGDTLVNGLLITPWPAGMVRTEQQKEFTGKVLELLLTQALENVAGVKDGAWDIGRCIVALPNYVCNTPAWNWWTALEPLTKERLFALARGHLVFRWWCSGTLENLSIDIGSKEVAWP